jgi:hypothetical protein
MTCLVDTNKIIQKYHSLTLHRWRHMRFERQSRWKSRQVLPNITRLLKSKYSKIRTRTSSLKWVNNDGGKIILDSISSGWNILVFVDNLCRGGTQYVNLPELAFRQLWANFFALGGQRFESNMLDGILFSTDHTYEGTQMTAADIKALDK